MRHFRYNGEINNGDTETIPDETLDYIIESKIIEHMKEHDVGRTILYRHLRVKYGYHIVDRTLKRLYKRNQRKNSTMNEYNNTHLQKNQVVDTRSKYLDDIV